MHEIIFEYLNIFEISLSYLWAMKGVRHFASILIWKKKKKLKLMFYWKIQKNQLSFIQISQLWPPCNTLHKH